MNKNTFLLLFVTAASLLSCSDKDDGPYADYLVARPITMGSAEFKANTVAVTEPVPVQYSGKIYAYDNYIFVNDRGLGFHVMDNSNPGDPKKIAFIKIDGNEDISIKDDRLFADSYGDLVVFDISDIKNIRVINRLENVTGKGNGIIYSDNIVWPQADFYDQEGVDSTKEVIIGWEVRTEKRLVSEYESRWNGPVLDSGFSNSSESTTTTAPNTGQGGSLARFKIVGDYLYAIDYSHINIFDISDLNKPKSLNDVSVGFDIETIFNQGRHLFIGGSQGMYIYDISSPSKPTFVSEFRHGTACDPVVVDGNYAFVTLRGGGFCGTETGLYIIDISNISRPRLLKIYPMTGPYGLGIRDEKLFICDGDAGLKVYDKTNVEDLVKLNHFENIITYDVIPLQNSLLMIGDKVLYQYEYLDRNIRLLSTFDLK